MSHEQSSEQRHCRYCGERIERFGGSWWHAATERSVRYCYCGTTVDGDGNEVGGYPAVPSVRFSAPGNVGPTAPVKRCWCGAWMKPAGIGAYPYDCWNAEHHPDWMVYVGCEAGHTCWSAGPIVRNDASAVMALYAAS